MGSGADKGASGPHTLGHGTAQRKPRTKDAIQRGWREWREKEQRDDRETGRQTQREMENRETERKHTEGNEIDGDRNAETEMLRDREEKLERDSKMETEKDRRMRRASDGAMKGPPLPSHLALCPELIASLDSPGTRSVCWWLWSMAEARETASWSQRRSTGSGGPCARQLRLKGVLATTVLSSGSSRK